MKNRIIKSIIEAFSLQPNYIRIKGKPSKSGEYGKDEIKNIEKESKQVSSDKIVNILVGYNFDGQKRFEYLEESVNIEYL